MYEIITKHSNWDNFTSMDIDLVFQDLNKFIDANPDMDLRDYGSVLEAYGLAWSANSIENVDIMELDGRGIVVLLVAAYRGDHMCNGYFDELIHKGLVQKWITRLKEIDH